MTHTHLVHLLLVIVVVFIVGEALAMWWKAWHR